MLPTYEQVMKHCAFIRFGKKMSAKEPTFADISEEVAVQLKEIWEKASIPVVSHDRILQLLQKYHEKYKNLMKPFKERQNNDTYKAKLQGFKEAAQVTLFDIAACKCKCDLSSPLCTCNKSRKVPANEREFLLDQRTVRKMFISSVDKTESRSIKRKEKRKEREATKYAIYQNLPENQSTSSEACSSQSTVATPADCSSTSESDVDSDSEMQYNKTNNSQMRLDLQSLASVCDNTVYQTDRQRLSRLQF